MADAPEVRDHRTAGDHEAELRNAAHVGFGAMIMADWLMHRWNSRTVTRQNGRTFWKTQFFTVYRVIRAYFYRRQHHDDGLRRRHTTTCGRGGRPPPRALGRASGEWPSRSWSWPQ